MELTITFGDTRKIKWVQFIASIMNKCKEKESEEEKYLTFIFADSVRPEDLRPLHLTSLACLIDYAISAGFDVGFKDSNVPVLKFILLDLGFSGYWKNLKAKHAEGTRTDIFSLWRIDDGEKLVYADAVTTYFKRNVDESKDFSPLSTSLSEAYCNVFDHANASGNAFSLIMYDKQTERIKVSICDFGITIPASVERARNIASDEDALATAIQRNFTIQSKVNNRGFGMENILTNSDNARVFSRSALLLQVDGKRRFLPLGFAFCGTLIDLELKVSDLDTTEYETDFTF